MIARTSHLKFLHSQMYQAGLLTRTAKLARLSEILGRAVTTSKGLTTTEVNHVARVLAAEKTVLT